MKRLMNSNGVRKFEPRVGLPTLGLRMWSHTTLKAFANSFGVDVCASQYSQGINPGLEFANAFGVSNLGKAKRTWVRISNSE